MEIVLHPKGNVCIMERLENKVYVGYECPRNRVAVAIGQRRVLALVKEYHEQGFFVIANVNLNANDGVDLILVDKSTGKIVEVIESTNYGKSTSWVPNREGDRRLQRYVRTLNRFDELPDVKKTIVVSYLTNIFNEHEDASVLREMEESGIKVRVRCPQD